MTPLTHKFLVVGSDGLIGSQLRAHLEAQGHEALGTTRRPDHINGSTLLLNMGGDVEAWRIPFGLTGTIICAGIASEQACSDDPKATAAINIDSTVMLARRLVYTGSPVFFLSSGHVFDGQTPLVHEGTALSPTTEHGRQKAEAERRLASLGKAIAIVRLSSVMAPDDELIRGWAESLQNRQMVRPFSDVAMAPVPLWFATKALTAIMEQPAGRTWQISGEKDVSYADAAGIGARALGASADLVKPTGATDAGLAQSFRPCASLDCSRLKNDLGLVPPDVEQTITLAFTNPSALGEMNTN
jgi:dTDP-4-dehydrorhamnose reductase